MQQARIFFILMYQALTLPRGYNGEEIWYYDEDEPEDQGRNLNGQDVHLYPEQTRDLSRLRSESTYLDEDALEDARYPAIRKRLNEQTNIRISDTAGIIPTNKGKRLKEQNRRKGVYEDEPFTKKKDVSKRRLLMKKGNTPEYYGRYSNGRSLKQRNNNQRKATNFPRFEMEGDEEDEPNGYLENKLSSQNMKNVRTDYDEEEDQYSNGDLSYKGPSYKESDQSRGYKIRKENVLPNREHSKLGQREVQRDYKLEDQDQDQDQDEDEDIYHKEHLEDRRSSYNEKDLRKDYDVQGDDDHSNDLQNRKNQYKDFKMYDDAEQDGGHLNDMYSRNSDARQDKDYEDDDLPYNEYSNYRHNKLQRHFTLEDDYGHLQDKRLRHNDEDLDKDYEMQDDEYPNDQRLSYDVRHKPREYKFGDDDQSVNLKTMHANLIGKQLRTVMNAPKYATGVERENSATKKFGEMPDTNEIRPGYTERGKYETYPWLKPKAFYRRFNQYNMRSRSFGSNNDPVPVRSKLYGTRMEDDSSSELYNYETEFPDEDGESNSSEDYPVVMQGYSMPLSAGLAMPMYGGRSTPQHRRQKFKAPPSYDSDIEDYATSNARKLQHRTRRTGSNNEYSHLQAGGPKRSQRRRLRYAGNRI